MRVAILSDIHGNSIALNAVLSDIETQGGAEAYWLVGDLAAMGPDPVGVMQRLQLLPNRQMVRGNTDRWLMNVHTELSAAALQEFISKPDSLATALMLRYAMVWAQGALSAGGYLGQIATLPLDYRCQLEDGTRVLCVHASPGQDDGEGIRPIMSDAQIAAAINGAAADLIFVGHTHVAMDRTVNRVRVVNLGSISLQPAPDLRASYVMLESDARGYRLRHCQVPYEHQRVVNQVNALGHPAAAIITAFMTGKRKPVWES